MNLLSFECSHKLAQQDLKPSAPVAMVCLQCPTSGGPAMDMEPHSAGLHQASSNHPLHGRALAAIRCCVNLSFDLAPVHWADASVQDEERGWGEPCSPCRSPLRQQQLCKAVQNMVHVRPVGEAVGVSDHEQQLGSGLGLLLQEAPSSEHL